MFDRHSFLFSFLFSRLLSGLVNFDGFYLESDPCLVCNNPEVPYNISKLSALKSDARFSTTSHMVKLVGSHNISKVTLRVTDVKRQKMVRHVSFHVDYFTMISTTISLFTQHDKSHAILNLAYGIE